MQSRQIHLLNLFANHLPRREGLGIDHRCHRIDVNHSAVPKEQFSCSGLTMRQGPGPACQPVTADCRRKNKNLRNSVAKSSSRYLRYPLVLERVIIYSFTVYIIYIERDHLIHMLGYTVLTKVDKIGLVGNWIPVLKQLTSDYTCQICTQTAAKCNLGFHKIDRLVRTQRESSLECKHECKPYRCLHCGSTERWTDCSPTCDHLASRV